MLLSIFHKALDLFFRLSGQKITYSPPQQAIWDFGESRDEKLWLIVVNHFSLLFICGAGTDVNKHGDNRSRNLFIARHNLPWKSIN